MPVVEVAENHWFKQDALPCMKTGPQRLQYCLALQKTTF